MRPFVLESRLLCAYVFALAAFNAGTAGAAYPDRPIRYIVPSAAGGGADALARILAGELTKQLGQQVVVDNRAGASGAIGMDMLVRANPDGYTIGYGNTPLLAINKPAGELAVRGWPRPAAGRAPDQFAKFARGGAGAARQIGARTDRLRKKQPG